MIAIQGTYSKITTALAVPNEYSINPFDLYGNLLSEMTIEVDSRLAQPTIFLPEIASLNNNWQIKINVIATNGSVFPVNVKVGIEAVDKISASDYLSLISDGSSVEINPIDANNWYGVVSDVGLTNPAYKVYTALLTQSGGDSPSEEYAGDEIYAGITYYIFTNDDNFDLVQYGAPNSNVGTYFVCNQNANLPSDINIQLNYNEGAPVVTVLENTIGSIGFSYSDLGVYKLHNSTLTNESELYFNIQSQEISSLGCAWNDEDGSGAFILSSIITDIGTVRSNDLLSNTSFEIRVYN